MCCNITTIGNFDRITHTARRAPDNLNIERVKQFYSSVSSNMELESQYMMGIHSVTDPGAAQGWEDCYLLLEEHLQSYREARYENYQYQLDWIKRYDWHCLQPPMLNNTNNGKELKGL